MLELAISCLRCLCFLAYPPLSALLRTPPLAKERVSKTRLLDESVQSRSRNHFRRQPASLQISRRIFPCHVATHLLLQVADLCDFWPVLSDYCSCCTSFG